MKKADLQKPASQPNQSQGHFNPVKGNSLAKQRMRLITALRAAPVDTFRARGELDIMHPAGRVKELRALGYNIHLTWIYKYSEAGEKHRIGQYSLLAGTWKGDAA